MTDNPTADQILNDCVFDKSIKNGRATVCVNVAIEAMKRYASAQQSPVTDISVNYLVKILKRTLKGNSEVRVEFETEDDNINYILDVCNNFKLELEKDRDAQPKTDDWICGWINDGYKPPCYLKNKMKCEDCSLSLPPNPKNR